MNLFVHKNTAVVILEESFFEIYKFYLKEGISSSGISNCKVNNLQTYDDDTPQIIVALLPPPL